MGASAREIERQISQTRQRMDQNLTRLEGSAATNALRYARWAAVGLGVVAVSGVALLVFRRRHRPGQRMRNDRSAEPGMLEATIRKLAPAVVGAASTAVLQRIVRTRAAESEKS